MGLLTDRVAIVTGAGRGIGREHALLLATEGASVLVNDLPGSDGSDPAGDVVREILEAGGVAVASNADITNWTAAAGIVDHAVQEFGDLHVLVNNAGILRDAFVASLDETTVDAVLAVHLKGHLAMLHHAAAYWKARSKAGHPVNASVVNTTSMAGTTWMNPGQGVYGAGKAGIAALSGIAAAELDRYGVRVNAIAPIARTRLTLATPGLEEIFAAEVAPDDFDRLGPQNIAPLVAHLASATCDLSGETIQVQGGEISFLRGWQVDRRIHSDAPWNAAELGDVLESRPAERSRAR